MDESLPQGGDFFYYAIDETTKKVPTVHLSIPKYNNQRFSTGTWKFFPTCRCCQDYAIFGDRTVRRPDGSRAPPIFQVFQIAMLC